MSGYEYIIASLPDIDRDPSKCRIPPFGEVVEEIRSRCPERDLATLDFFLKGLEPDNLDEEFYRKALGSKDRFTREYFRYDLMVRNLKADYINRSLGRPQGTDVISPDGEEPDAEEAAAVDAVLEGKDLLGRERGLDALMWDRSEELTALDVLDLDVVLGFITRLRTVSRWLALDPETGKAFFRRLVDGIRQTYTNKENE